MKELEHEGGLFSWQSTGEVTIIRMKRSVVDFAGDLETKRDFFAHLSKAEEQRDVKALFLIYSRDSLTSSKYEDFVNQVLAANGTTRSREIDLLRSEHALRQYIMRAAQFSKLLISCFQGQVASPFFGAQLASDIRIACEDTVVPMSHIKLGIPPDGALGFFLPRYLGLGRSSEILLSEKPLNAGDLLALGLVNAVVASETFEADCLRIADQFLSTPASRISFTKEVTNPSQDTLRRYLEAEFSAVTRALLIPGTP